MVVLKRLIIAPLFLVVFALLIYQLNPLFSSYEIIFSLSLNTLIQLVTLSILILLTSFLFILFVSLSQDWKFTLPVGGVASLIPLVLTPQPLSIILAIGTSISILLSYLTLENKLKSYLTFEANSLLGPSIRHLAGLLVLVIALVFYLSINKTIQQNGFQIPDSLINTALKFAGSPPGESTQQEQATQPQLTKEQIELLKKNPELLKLNGLDPKILDSLNQPSSKSSSSASQNLIKKAVKDQLQNLLKPYLGIIPAVLAVLLFFTLESLVSLLGIFIYPLLWITFYIFKKINFVRFEVEQRTVNKMVV